MSLKNVFCCCFKIVSSNCGSNDKHPVRNIQLVSNTSNNHSFLVLIRNKPKCEQNFDAKRRGQNTLFHGRSGHFVSCALRNMHGKKKSNSSFSKT